jgi:hypothetical protein
LEKTLGDRRPSTDIEDSDGAQEATYHGWLQNANLPKSNLRLAARPQSRLKQLDIEQFRKSSLNLAIA